MSKDFSTWYGVPEVNKVQCKACKCVFARKISRMLSHLGYEGPTGHRDRGIGLCSQLTSATKLLFVNCRGLFPGRAIAERVDGNDMPITDSNLSNDRGTPSSMQEDSCTAPEEVVAVGSQVTPNTEMTESRGNRHTSRASSSRPATQSRLVDGFDESNRRKLNATWAHFFYSANIPFSVARNPAFREAVKLTAEFKKSYVPPSYNDLRHKLLQQAKSDIQTKLHQRTEDSVRKFGATLSFDGWSSVTNRPLINAMLISSAGEQFLGSVDTSGQKKTATYIASILEEFIEQVGSKNVVQVTADNTNTNPAAWNLVSDKYPHIYFQGCVVHALNLLLKDWAKQTWIKDYVKAAEAIVKFFRKRHMPLAIFRKYETRFSLLKPLETRFASYFIMIDRLLEVKDALKQSVVDPQWGAYVNTLDDRDKAKSRSKSRIVYNTVVDEHFWDRLTNVRELTAPIVFGLRDLDAKTPCMGKVLHIMRNLEKHVFGLRRAPFCLSVERAIPLEESFVKRREMGETDLHYAGALLNPYLLHDKELADDQNATERCKKVIMRICDPDNYAKVVKEFVAFRHREPPFHNMLEPNEQMLSAHAWWDFEGACGKLIAPIAKRILAQPVSSSACERNWSSYSYVHNKSRNKLATTRAADLVYVYTNSKVVAASKNKDEKKWYKDNVDSESSEAGSDAEDVDDRPHPLDHFDEDAEDNDMPNWHDETYQSPNRTNGGWRGNNIGIYDFESDEENDGYGEDLPHIARCVDGSGYLNSENILSQREDTFVEIAEADGTILPNGGTDEVIRTCQSPSAGGLREKDIDEQNDGGRCPTDDEEVPINANVQSKKALGSKNNGEPNTGNNNAIAIIVNGSQRGEEAESPSYGKSFERRNEIMQDSRKPPHNGAPSAIFGSSSRIWDGSRGSTLGHRLVNVGKAKQPCIERTGTVLSSTDDDGELTLAEIARGLVQHTAPPRRNLQSPAPPPQSSKATNIIIHGGSQAVKLQVKAGTEGSKKRPMQPFAVSPVKKLNAGRTPLDACLPVAKRKTKPVPCPSSRDETAKAILKIKQEHKKSVKRRKTKRCKQVEGGGSSSDGMENTSSDEDVGYRRGCESSGAEVKGDEDYCPSN